LIALPVWLQNLESLSELYLHKNGRVGMPPEVLGPTARAVSMGRAIPAKPTEILEYYFRVRAASRPLNEAKLILVGRGGVGKTSIVARLIHDKFERDGKKTEGIQINQWKISLRGHEDVRLNIWDFGGQEIQHATHQFFLTQRSIYLLVLNGREELGEADADYWLRLIDSFGHDSPVIVVLNKIKECHFELNRRGLKGKFTGHCPFRRNRL